MEKQMIWRKVMEKKTNGESITDEIIIEMHIYIKGTYLL